MFTLSGLPKYAASAANDYGCEDSSHSCTRKPLSAVEAARLAMDKQKSNEPRQERANRRGCILLAVLMLLILAALAYIGFSADPISEIDSSIPAIGAARAD